RAIRLIVRERRHEMIRRPRRALEHLALVVRAVGDFLLGGDALHLVFAVADAAAWPIRTEIVISDEVQRMAIGADALIDLETALHRGAIVGAERPVEGPARPRQRRLFLSLGDNGSE